MHTDNQKPNNHVFILRKRVTHLSIKIEIELNSYLIKNE